MILGLLLASQLEGQSTVYYVSTSGNNANPGTAAQPFRTPQRGADVAQPGDTILVLPGTYVGRVVITRSGTTTKPITLRSQKAGMATLTASFTAEPCSRQSPTFARTIAIRDGVDYWLIEGFNIVNGITIYGTNLSALTSYKENDKTLPGRGLYDPQAAKGTLGSLGSNGADGIRILANTITGRGIYAAAARYGRVLKNTIRNIQCATGGGVWLGKFSDGWIVRDNTITDIATSDYHWMSEGVRGTGGSMYNLIENNRIERMAGVGRGVGMDNNASWNVIQGNLVRESEIAFSEQRGNWGNHWFDNVAEVSRRFSFAVALFNPTPTQEVVGVPKYLELRCNKSTSSPLGLNVGFTVDTTFDSNSFQSVTVSQNLLNYWPQSDNIWEGSSNPPSQYPSATRFAANCG